MWNFEKWFRIVCVRLCFHWICWQVVVEFLWECDKPCAFIRFGCHMHFLCLGTMFGLFSFIFNVSIPRIYGHTWWIPGKRNGMTTTILCGDAIEVRDEVSPCVPTLLLLFVNRSAQIVIWKLTLVHCEEKGIRVAVKPANEWPNSRLTSFRSTLIIKLTLCIQTIIIIINVYIMMALRSSTFRYPSWSLSLGVCVCLCAFEMFSVHVLLFSVVADRAIHSSKCIFHCFTSIS